MHCAWRRRGGTCAGRGSARGGARSAPAASGRSQCRPGGAICSPAPRKATRPAIACRQRQRALQETFPAPCRSRPPLPPPSFCSPGQTSASAAASSCAASASALPQSSFSVVYRGKRLIALAGHDHRRHFPRSGELEGATSASRRGRRRRNRRTRRKREEEGEQVDEEEGAELERGASGGRRGGRRKRRTRLREGGGGRRKAWGE